MAYSDFSLSSVLKTFQLSYSETANLFANEQKLAVKILEILV
ncbi:hypothetical protein [Tychonema sp. LEGE 06208]|nr:hypothetical protein [Tychonema sp. LEGE 06208]